MKSYKPYKDISGQRFGRLVAVEFIEKRNGKAFWLFLCDCGKTKVISRSSVVIGDTKSCGCFHKETSAQNGRKSSTTHAMSYKPFYAVWQSMKQRTSNPKTINWKYYGELGIAVCERWQIFQNFYDDMYKSYLEFLEKHPGERATLERINVYENYEPENVEWKTYKEQANNKRNNRILCFENRCQTISQWANETGLSHHRIGQRINIWGWSVEKALTTPVDRRKARHT